MFVLQALDHPGEIRSVRRELPPPETRWAGLAHLETVEKQKVRTRIQRALYVRRHRKAGRRFREISQRRTQRAESDARRPALAGLWRNLDVEIVRALARLAQNCP